MLWPTLLGPGLLMGRKGLFSHYGAPEESPAQRKGLKALDYGSPWNASAFPKVFLVLFVHKENSTLKPHELNIENQEL